MYKYFLIVYIFANVLLVSAQAQEGYDVPRLPVPIEIEDQPIPFSHELHSSIGLQCATCHIGSEDGRSMTLPITGTCVGCHSVIATERESIQTLLTYHDLGEVIPWVRIYAINEGITWNHQNISPSLFYSFCRVYKCWVYVIKVSFFNCCSAIRDQCI